MTMQHPWAGPCRLCLMLPHVPWSLEACPQPCTLPPTLLTHSLTLGWPPRLPLSLGFPRSRRCSAAGCLAVEIPHLPPTPKELLCLCLSTQTSRGLCSGQPHALSPADLAPWRTARRSLRNPPAPPGMSKPWQRWRRSLAANTGPLSGLGAGECQAPGIYLFMDVNANRLFERKTRTLGLCGQPPLLCPCPSPCRARPRRPTPCPQGGAKGSEHPGLSQSPVGWWPTPPSLQAGRVQ